MTQILPRNSVGTAQLKNRAVTTAKLRNQAVTNAKIRRNTITSNRIRNGTLRRADFAPGELFAEGGAPGPAGPPGVSGLQRVDIASATSSVDSRSVALTCPAGKRVLGGGARVTGEGSNRVSIVESYPGDANTWNARAAEVVSTTAQWQLHAFALCANVAD